MQKNLVTETLKRIEELSVRAEENYEKSRIAKKQMKDFYNKARATDREIEAELIGICKSNGFVAKDFAELIVEACEERKTDLCVWASIRCKITLLRLPDDKLARLAPALIDNYCVIEPNNRELSSAREVLSERIQEIVNNNAGFSLDLFFGNIRRGVAKNEYCLSLPIKPNNEYFDLDKFLANSTFVIDKDATGHHLAGITNRHCDDMKIRIPSVYIQGKKQLSVLAGEKVVSAVLLKLITNEKYTSIEK